MELGRVTPKVREAHDRLLAALPVRTIILNPGDENDGCFEGGHGGPRSLSKPIEVNGKRYPSFNRARKALRAHPNTLYFMLARGEARYL